jgi:hypothetical protein
VCVSAAERALFGAFVAAAAAVTVACAAGASSVACAPPAPFVPAPTNTTVTVVNPGLNFVALWVCNAADTAACTPGSSAAVAPCNSVVLGNSSLVVSVDVSATALVLQVGREARRLAWASGLERVCWVCWG